jgi:hypothetical protein
MSRLTYLFTEGTRSAMLPEPNVPAGPTGQQSHFLAQVASPDPRLCFFVLTDELELLEEELEQPCCR